MVHGNCLDGSWQKLIIAALFCWLRDNCNCSQFRNGYVACDQNIPWSKFSPCLKVSVTSTKMLHLFLKISVVFCQLFLWALTSFTVKNQHNLFVLLTAVEAACIFLPPKQNPHQQLKISMLIFCKAYKFSNGNSTDYIKTKLISSRQKIWRKIGIRSNTDVFSWLKLFINYLKEKKVSTWQLCKFNIMIVPVSELKRRHKIVFSSTCF